MVQQLLLAGQLLVVVLVYVFVWRVVKSARRDLASGGSARHSQDMSAQESTIIPAADARAARRSAGLSDPRIIVEQSEVLRAGIPFTIGAGLAFGRTPDNDVVLDESVVSGRHMRMIAPGTVIDEGSTNGTFVNGQQAQGRIALRDGDIVQVGSTVFRYEDGRR
ncbi:MAG: FHA domain-containing protein [Gaiellales bacterium]